MSAYNTVLDPPEVATGRQALALNSGAIRVIGAIDWGSAAVALYEADEMWGSVPVDFRVPNRTVTIPLLLGADDGGQTSFDNARKALQQKVALFQREGGWLLRGDTGMYLDIVDATLTKPDEFGERGAAEPNVTLVLEAIPDFYGDEISLDTLTAATGVCRGVLKQDGVQAVIGGDWPGRCRIVVTDSSGNDQLGLPWGLRSRHYDPTSTAALFYEAEALTPLDAATTFVHADASGGSTMRHNSLPGGSWCPVLLSDLLTETAGLTHQGSYQIRARAYSATAAPQLRLVWGVGDVAHPVTNAAVPLPGAGDFYLVDLGAVRLDAPPVGNYRWHGVIQALAAADGDPVEIDCLYLQPLDEYAGKCVAVQSDSALAINAVRVAGAGADDAGTGAIAWSNPSGITAEDGNVALAAPGTSHYLKSSAHGFAIPSGATISGIKVEIKRQASHPLGGFGGFITDNRVRLVRAGTVEGVGDHADSLTPWPSSLQWKGYGGPGDLWGATWTPADINNGTFGAALSAGPSSAEVDCIRITVYYTTAGGFTSTPDAVCYATRRMELRTDGMFRQDSTGSVEGPVALVTGDLPRLPPSGMEGRTVELFVKPSRGDLDTLPDSGLDGFTVKVLYRPSWLFPA